jgi:uncharacterized repeat protein (TIGR03803 family)
MSMSRILAGICALLFTLSASVFAQSYKMLYEFGVDPAGPGSANYWSTLVQSRGGYLFDTSNGPIIFRMTPSGKLTVISNKAGRGGLSMGTDGRFYGSSVSGGAHGLGMVYQVDSLGNFKILHSFGSTNGDGDSPAGAPVQSFAGNYFYGTTSSLATQNDSTVYRVNKYGKYELLKDVPKVSGTFMYYPLVQGPDFYFYGTAPAGGAHNAGSIFRINSAGSFEVLYDFDGTLGSPWGGLVQTDDGSFYGVTQTGGPNGTSSSGGVLYRLAPDRTFTVLHSFGAAGDGTLVQGGLTIGNDGNLYGTTSYGGANGSGVLFRIAPDGSGYSILYNFVPHANGNYPLNPLTQHTNGRFYGTTGMGGNNDFTVGDGVIFSYDAGLPPFVSYLPVYGSVGAKVDILGQGFTASSQASFNGVPAQTTVVYPTYLTAIVPAGATTGYITVTTASGTLKSNRIFTVQP